MHKVPTYQLLALLPCSLFFLTRDVAGSSAMWRLRSSVVPGQRFWSIRDGKAASSAMMPNKHKNKAKRNDPFEHFFKTCQFLCGVGGGGGGWGRKVEVEGSKGPIRRFTNEFSKRIRSH